MLRRLGLQAVLFAILAAGATPAIAAAPPARTTPVPLTAQPGTQLDSSARALMAADLAEAGRSGEKPLLLVGSAKLGAGAADRPALFAQLQSARECGSAGCSTSAYLWRNGTWKRVLDGVGGKVAVASTRTKGMADLITENARYVWNGTDYRDARPAPQVDLTPRTRR